MVVNIEKKYLYLIEKDSVFKSIKIYHIIRFRCVMVWMKNKSLKKYTNLNLCITYTLSMFIVNPQHMVEFENLNLKK